MEFMLVAWILRTFGLGHRLSRRRCSTPQSVALVPAAKPLAEKRFGKLWRGDCFVYGCVRHACLAWQAFVSQGAALGQRRLTTTSPSTGGLVRWRCFRKPWSICVRFVPIQHHQPRKRRRQGRSQSFVRLTPLPAWDVNVCASIYVLFMHTPSSWHAWYICCLLFSVDGPDRRRSTTTWPWAVSPPLHSLNCFLSFVFLKPRQPCGPAGYYTRTTCGKTGTVALGVSHGTYMGCPLYTGSMHVAVVTACSCVQ
jgi:hypothetical protein